MASLSARARQAFRVLTNRDLASDEILGWRMRTGGSRGRSSVSQERALRHSGWWACLRLRADLESMMPFDAFRLRDGYQVEVPKPDLLREPMPGVDITEHLYSSRVDLDRYGNSVSVITARNAFGLPAALDLAPMGDTTAVMSGRLIKEWRICGQRYLPDEIWHERQYTVGGWPLGLSPLAYAAWTVNGYLSAQEFALDWFGGGATPRGTLKNTLQTLKPGQVDDAKAKFKAATENGDIFVTGNDWEWTPAVQDAASAGFLDAQNASLLDTCRYLGVPGDMVDAATQGSAVTYANVTQRNLQLLITNMGPAIHRRERKWSTALPKPRFVKLNTDAMLRMDPQTREAVILSRVAGRTLGHSEARALDNLPPFTDEQLAEFAYFEQIKAKQQVSPQQAAAAGWEIPA
jgi:HK97 family phage portal protein